MTPTSPPRGPRSLSPREHGAYGQLFVPLAAALAMGSPTLGAVALAVPGVAAFFAHEPALVVLGRRGPRTQREDGARAWSRLAWLFALAAAGGVVAIVSVPVSVLAVAAVPAVLGALVIGLVARGEEKTAAGETAASIALAAVGLPVAAASGVPWDAALGAWGAFCVAFGASTWAVRSVVAHQRAQVAAWRRLAAPCLFASVGLAMFALGRPPWYCAVAAAPMLTVALVIAASPPHPRHLRRVGFSLLGASVAGACILVAFARLAM